MISQSHSTSLRHMKATALNYCFMDSQVEVPCTKYAQVICRQATHGVPYFMTWRLSLYDLWDVDPHPTDHEAGSVFCNLWERVQGIRATWWTETLEATKQVAISRKLQQDLSGTVA